MSPVRKAHRWPLMARGKVISVRFEPSLIRPGVVISVLSGAGAKIRSTKYVVFYPYAPQVGVIVAHRPGSRVLRSIDPRDVTAVEPPRGDPDAS